MINRWSLWLILVVGNSYFWDLKWARRKASRVRVHVLWLYAFEQSFILMAVHKSGSQSDQNVIVCVWSSENTNMAFLRHIMDQDYNRHCNDQILLSCPSIFFFITPFSYLPRLRDFYISLHRGCVESRSPWCNLLLGLSSVYFGPSACFCQTPFLVLRLCLCLGIHHIPFASDTGEIINKIFNLRFKGNSKVIAEHGLDCVVLGKQWYICVSDKLQKGLAPVLYLWLAHALPMQIVHIMSCTQKVADH